MTKREIGIFESIVVDNPQNLSYSGLYNGWHYHLIGEGALLYYSTIEFWDGIHG